MKIEFDGGKDKINVAKHSISLARAADFEILAFVQTTRKGERRIQAFGLIDGDYHSLTFVFRRNVVRPISLRRAHEKEIEAHVAR